MCKWVDESMGKPEMGQVNRIMGWVQVGLRRSFRMHRRGIMWWFKGRMGCTRSIGHITEPGRKDGSWMEENCSEIVCEDETRATPASGGKRTHVRRAVK